MPTHAAGFVLFHDTGPARRFLLLRNARHCTWGFPKGHQAPGEGEMGAAVRETVEETGITGFAPRPGFRRAIAYQSRDGGAKVASYFVAAVASTEWRRSPEHDAGDWYTAAECHERLQHGALHTLLDDVAAWLDAPPAVPEVRRQVLACVVCAPLAASTAIGGQALAPVPAPPLGAETTRADRTPVLEVHADYGRLYALLGADPTRAPRLADTYVRCAGCGLVHLTHRLDDDLWHAFTFAAPDPAKHAHDVPRLAAVAAHDAALVHRHAGGGRWLEIGCGYGYTLAAARALGIDAHGIDLAPGKLACARDRLGVPAEALHLGDPMGLDLPTGGFQAVLLVHVLEHLASPVQVLRRVAGWLAPGGVALIATPNLASWKARSAGARWGYATPFGHLALYERATLARVLRDAGLRVRAPVRRVAKGTGRLAGLSPARAAKRALAALFPDALSELCLLAERG